MLLANTHGIVLMLWGGNAKDILKSIDSNVLAKHYILEANHPSPLSANRGGWFGCRHFSKLSNFWQILEDPDADWNSVAATNDKN